jgi:CheY-like chemotaxis protein
MTLRLTDEQTEGLRRRAKAEHRSMQQVVLAAIDAYVSQPVSPPQQREAVQVSRGSRGARSSCGAGR